MIRALPTMARMRSFAVAPPSTAAMARASAARTAATARAATALAGELAARCSQFTVKVLPAGRAAAAVDAALASHALLLLSADCFKDPDAALLGVLDTAARRARARGRRSAWAPPPGSRGRGSSARPRRPATAPPSCCRPWRAQDSEFI